MRTDVNASLGAYRFRREPEATVADVVRGMDRVEIDRAWVSWLPAITGHAKADEALRALETAARQERRLAPVPSVIAKSRGWERTIKQAGALGAPAVRCDPMFLGLDPTGAEVRAVADAATAAGLPLVMAVRLEDGRQRVPKDQAAELPPWAVRALIRHNRALKLVVTHADRAFVEEVHFGSTPEEAARIWWDIAWLWGPPEDHLGILLRTLGAARLVFGTGQPLRIPEVAVAKLDLADLEPSGRQAIEGGNLALLHP